MKEDYFVSNKKPVPTEYKGIVFKSKSEAIFARCIDLWLASRYDLVGSYVYEPVDWWIAQMDYVPDFDLMTHLHNQNHRSTTLIEYKPVKPTDAYMNKLAERAEYLFVMSADKQISDFDFFVCYGNAYDGYLEAVGYDVQAGFFVTNASWFSDQILPFIDKAKSHRFDLGRH